jgi:transposase
VLDQDGQVVWQGKVDSEPGPLIEKLRLWHDQIDLVGLEACPLSEWLHRHLVAAGFKAICVETRAVFDLACLSTETSHPCRLQYDQRRRPIARDEILAQADRNRRRMRERDPARRRELLSELQEIADDPVRRKAHLMRTSMIDGLRRASAVF